MEEKRRLSHLSQIHEHSSKPREGVSDSSVRKYEQVDQFEERQALQMVFVANEKKKKRKKRKTE
jgi:hypothetical protein